MKNPNLIDKMNGKDPNDKPKGYSKDGTPKWTIEQTKEHQRYVSKEIAKKIGGAVLAITAMAGAYQVTKSPDVHPSNETVQLQPGQTKWDIATEIANDYNSNPDNFKHIDTGDALTAINEVNPNDNDGVDQVGETIVVPQIDKW